MQGKLAVSQTNATTVAKKKSLNHISLVKTDQSPFYAKSVIGLISTGILTQ